MYNRSGYGSLGFNSPEPFVPEEIIITPPEQQPTTEANTATIRRRKKKKRYFTIRFIIVGYIVNSHIVQINDIQGSKLSRFSNKSLNVATAKKFKFSNTIQLIGNKRKVFNESFPLIYKNKVSFQTIITSKSFHGFHDTKQIIGSLKNYFRITPKLYGEKIQYFNTSGLILGYKIKIFENKCFITGKRNLKPLIEALEFMTVLDEID